MEAVDVVVVKRSAVPDGGGTIVPVSEELAVALFRVGDTFHAIDNRCPHKGGPLGRGAFDGTVVQCPWHAFTIDVRSGRCPRHQGLWVRTFPVEVAGEDVRITIS